MLCESPPDELDMGLAASRLGNSAVGRHHGFGRVLRCSVLVQRRAPCGLASNVKKLPIATGPCLQLQWSDGPRSRSSQTFSGPLPSPRTISGLSGDPPALNIYS